MYPLIELTMGLLAWLLYRRFVPSPAALDPTHLMAWAFYLVFCYFLLLAAFTDIRTRIIPELASTWAIPAGIAATAILDAVGYHGWLSIGWRASVLGAFASFMLLGGLSKTWYVLFQREGLGWGDVMLVTMMGTFLGPMPGMWLVLMMGSMFGAIVGMLCITVLRRNTFMPFGPSLSMAGVVYVLYGDHIVATFLPGMQHLL